MPWLIPDISGRDLLSIPRLQEGQCSSASLEDTISPRGSEQKYGLTAEAGGLFLFLVLG